MFTGLVAATGRLTSISKSNGDAYLEIDLGDLATATKLGDSVALSGVCCTVTRIEGSVCAFVLSPETLRRTWLGALRVDGYVNIEMPLRPSDPMGGHMVQGHVDGVGELVSAIHPEQGGELWARIPRELGHYCVVKGSIALDGVSLTIAGLEEDRMMAAIIPHTAQVTTLGQLRPGDPLNVEVDILAKYVERLLEARFGPSEGA